MIFNSGSILQDGNNDAKVKWVPALATHRHWPPCENERRPEVQRLIAVVILGKERAHIRTPQRVNSPHLCRDVAHEDNSTAQDHKHTMKEKLSDRTRTQVYP